MQAQARHTCQGGLIHQPHARLVTPRSVSRCNPVLQRACRQPQAFRHVVAATSTDQLPELTQKLRDVIQTNDAATAFPPDALPVLEQIDSIVQEHGVPEITAESIRGRFRQVLSNTNLVDADGSLTLGTLTFNQFGPKDLKVQLQGVQLLQGVESPDQYSTEASFQIIDGELDGVEGVQKALGHYEVTGEKPGRQDVYFSGVAIFPKHPEDRERWVAAMKEHNPSMDDTGRAEIQFPGSAAHGFRDFRIIEDNLTLTVGNRKSFVCVQPL